MVELGRCETLDSGKTYRASSLPELIGDFGMAFTLRYG
jgi:hypothetical protein